jgi:hypothetical protein
MCVGGCKADAVTCTAKRVAFALATPSLAAVPRQSLCGDEVGAEVAWIRLDQTT